MPVPIKIVRNGKEKWTELFSIHQIKRPYKKLLEREEVDII